MLNNSRSWLVNQSLSTQLFINSIELTKDQIQSNIDAYLTLGYKPFDITSTSSDMGFSRIPATTSTSLLCLFISTYPQGTYYLTTQWLNGTATSMGKDIVIMGCKVPTTSCVLASSSDANLDVWFTQMKHYTSSAPMTISPKLESISAHFWNYDKGMNYSGISLNNMTLNNHYLCQMGTNAINNSIIKSYAPLILLNNHPSLYDVENNMNDTIGNYYTYITSSVPYYPGAFYIDNGIIYVGQLTNSGIVNKINMETLTLIASLDIGRNITCMCGDNNYIYCGRKDVMAADAGLIVRILKSDFTTFSTKDISHYSDCICCNETYIMTGNNTDNTVTRILVSDFNTLATKSIGQTSRACCNDNTYCYFGGSGTNDVIRLTISDWNTTATKSISQTTYSMCTNGSYVFCGGGANTLIGILISDWTTTISKDIGRYTHGLCTNGRSLFSVYGTDYEIIELLISDFNSIGYYNNGYVTASLIISSGNYLFTIASPDFTGNHYNVTKIIIGNPSINTNFAQLFSLKSDRITSTSYYKILNCDINTQYQIYYSQLGKTTRNFYNISFRADAPVDDTLKKFNINYNWIIKRTDIETVLCPTTNTTDRIRLYNLGMIYSSSTGEYTFDHLSMDENFLMRGTTTSGDEQYFMYYNGKVHQTYINQGIQNPQMNLYYSITNVFQIMDYERVDDVRNLIPGSVNSPISGGVLLNNNDNEWVI